MDDLWPWLAVAAAGALHGMNPASGWAFAAWRGHRDGSAPALAGLAPIAAGHLASVVLVAAAVPAALAAGRTFDPRLPQGLAAALLLLLAVRHFRRRAPRRAGAPATGAGPALWSFIAGTAHGAGWMLVPALAPLCVGDAPGREITASGSLLPALGAVGVHLAAMLATLAAMAAGAQRGLDAAGRWLDARRRRRAAA